MKKSKLRVLAVALVTGMILSGCGAASGSGSSKKESKASDGSTKTASASKTEASGETSKEEVTLKMACWGSENDIKTYEERAALVHEKYPEITLEVMAIPNDGYDTKVQTMIASGDAPDIIQVGEASNSYASKGVLVDLTKLSEAAGLDLAKRFGTATSTYTWQNTLYAMPDRGGAMIVYYNKDMFDKAGVSYPTKDWTWKDLLEAAQKLTITKDGVVEQYGFAAGGWWPWWMSFMYQNGGSILDSNLEKVTVNSPENVEAINFYTDLVHKYKVAPSADDYSRFGLKDGQPDPLFAQGHCAINITGFWNVGSLESVEGLNWDMAPMWKNKVGATFSFGSGLAIPKGGKNVDAAFRAIEFLTSLEGQKPIVENKQDAPANVELLQSDLFLKPAWAEGRNMNFNAFAESADIIVSPPLHPKWNEIQRVFDENFSVLFAEGGDCSETLKKIEKELNEVIK